MPAESPTTAVPPVAPAPPTAPAPPRPAAEAVATAPTCPDLVAAARDGHAEQLRAWRDAGADLDARCGSRTPLGLAALTCDSAAAALLLDLGADPNVCVPLPGKTTCGSAGGLGSVVHGRYPLGEAERMLRLAENSGDAEDIAACAAVRDRLAERTGRVPEDLRPAR